MIVYNLLPPTLVATVSLTISLRISATSFCTSGLVYFAFDGKRLAISCKSGLKNKIGVNIQVESSPKILQIKNQIFQYEHGMADH